MSKPFKDSAGLIGRPRIAPKAETSVKANPQARSIRKLEGKIHAEIRGSKLILDFSEVISHKCRINKSDAINFAEWILFKYK